jgi:hypothetical protein
MTFKSYNWCNKYMCIFTDWNDMKQWAKWYTIFGTYAPARKSEVPEMAAPPISQSKLWEQWSRHSNLLTNMTQKDSKPQQKMKDLNNHLLTTGFNSGKIMADSISRGTHSLNSMRRQGGVCWGDRTGDACCAFNQNGALGCNLYIAGSMISYINHDVIRKP